MIDLGRKGRFFSPIHSTAAIAKIRKTPGRLPGQLGWPVRLSRASFLSFVIERYVFAGICSGKTPTDRRVQFRFDTHASRSPPASPRRESWLMVC
jgi:hypothetical protein